MQIKEKTDSKQKACLQGFLWSRDKFSSSVVSLPSTNQRRHVSLVRTCERKRVCNTWLGLFVVEKNAMRRFICLFVVWKGCSRACFCCFVFWILVPWRRKGFDMFSLVC